MSSVAASIASLSPEKRAAILDGLTADSAAELLRRWEFWARPEQIQPAGAWRTWLILAGRGWGKSRTGAEWVRAQVKAGLAGRIALVARTASDVRDVIVEGESGILAISPKDERPTWEPSRRRLTWPNGAQATTYSADEPDQLRGPQHDGAWCDELAAWRYPETWDQLRFGLRLGAHPRVVVTTTPRPTKIIRDLIASPATVVTRGRTRDNVANLAPGVVAELERRYAGSRLGRQELDGEVIDDSAGALWRLGQIDADRVDEAPELTRIAVAVDPSATNTETSAETGIVAGGVDARGHGYILRDASGKYTPGEWGAAAVLLHDALDADCIVVETNQGGDMAVHVLTTAAEKLFREKKRKSPHVTVRRVHASRGKRARAEAPAALSEQHRVHHVGCLPKLEDQLCTWDASDGSPSPDRLDALVWLVTWLMLTSGAAPDFAAAADALGDVPRRDAARASVWSDPEDDD